MDNHNEETHEKHIEHCDHCRALHGIHEAIYGLDFNDIMSVLAHVAGEMISYVTTDPALVKSGAEAFHRDVEKMALTMALDDMEPNTAH